jgi:hypothetical protein
MEGLALFLANQHPTVIFTILFALLGSPLAVTIIVLWTWTKDRHKQESLLGTYKGDMDKVLTSYGEHVRKLADYYERNVELVKSWQKIAEGFQSTVVLNTQTLTKVCDLVESNQFCPHVRINKTGRQV